MIRPFSHIGALALSAAFAEGCSGTADTPNDEVVAGQALTVTSAGGLATGTVRLEGDHIAEGKNAFLVDFDPTTTEVISASTLMPVHGHGSATPTVAHDGSGYRISDVIFNMPGLWEVRLDIDVAGKPDRVVFNADAP